MTDPAVDWVPLYFNKWLVGTMELTGPAELAYWRLCLHGYEKQSALVAGTDHRLARWCKLDAGAFAAAIDELVELGKVERVEGGLRVPSVETHLRAAVNRLAGHQRGAEIARRRKALKTEGKTPAEIDAVIAAEFDATPRAAKPAAAPAAQIAKPKRVAGKSDINASVMRDAVQAWNEMAQRNGLSQVASLAGQRKDRLHARLAEHGVEAYGTCLSNIATSDFLRGRGRGRDWKASFDFLLQPNSFLKVLEGQYNNRGGAQSTSEATAILHDMIEGNTK